MITRTDRVISASMRPEAPIPSVALFSDTYDEINGVAKTFRRLAKEFSKRNLTLHIYTYGAEEGVSDQGSVKVFRFRHRYAVRYYEHLRYELFKNVTVIRAFDSNLAAHRYGVVHIAAPGSMGWLGRTLALDRRLPLLGTYHTSLAEYTAERAPKLTREPIKRATWTFLKKFYKPCRQVLCPTHSIVDELQRNGFRNRLGIFTRGIDFKVFAPRESKAKKFPITVGYVGRLAPEKNVRALPQILGDLEVKALVVGDGPERGFLQRALPMAEFTGYLEGEELAKAYSKLDVLVFPSLTDTFGNVVLEAMASGAVPVVLKAPGPSDFVEPGVNAFVSRNVEEMRQYIGLLMDDAHMRHTMAEEAVQFARSRDWNAVFDRLVDDYRSSAEA